MTYEFRQEGNDTMMRYVPLEGYQHKCPECGKEFWAMADWAYKAGYANRPVYVCSWKCLQKRRKNGKKGGMKMPDRENVITHLQIIHTWAEFARERDLQFFTAKHLEDIAQWSDDAIALLKEQEDGLKHYDDGSVET